MTTSPHSDHPGRVVRILHGAIEAVVLLMVCLSPWAFGSIHPLFESLLYCGLALALLLRGASVLVSSKLTWQRCPVTLCLAVLILYGAVQLIDWPGDWLARLSPGTAWWRGQLLPDQPESLPGGEAAAMPVGATLSLYPSATRLALLRLLAVFLLFGVVRNTFASEKSLRRLAVVALINGALLSLVALVQFFSSRQNVVYWRFDTNGSAFGPFITRNHFPFYVNLCVGLGFGLLAWARGRRGEGWALGDILQRPALLWTCLALALMLSAVVFSLSRGGVMALLAGVGVYAAASWRAERWRAVAVPAAVLLLALGLLAWFGLPRVEARFASLWQGTERTGNRLREWSRNLTMARQFPVWGAGYGTFEWVAPLGLEPGDDPVMALTHAHNDYLEAWFEGGVVRLVVSLLAVFWVFRLGLMAYHRFQPRPAGGLVLGALAGFTTAAVHGFVDFGLHLPAIVVLTTVVAAHLTALGAGELGWRTPETLPFRLDGLARLAGAALLAVLAWLLVTQAYQRAQAERFRLAAVQGPGTLQERAKTPRDPERRIAYARSAVAYLPDDASLHAELADKHLIALEDELSRVTHRGEVVAAAHAVVAAQPLFSPGGPGPALLRCLVEGAVEKQVDAQARHRLEERHLWPALEHVVRARDLCPLHARAQALLGALRGRLSRADARVQYIERAAILRPADPEIWYILGLEWLRAGRLDQAGDAWERSLRCSSQFRDNMMQHCAGREDAAALLRQIRPPPPRGAN